MDYQQESLHFDMGYLLGIIDGEGSYILEMKYRHGETFNLIPRIMISNTNPDIIKFCASTLKRLGLPFHIWEGKPVVNRRVMYQVRIVGIKRVKRTTDLLLSYPSGKYEQAQLLNNWCRHRLSIPQREKDSGHVSTYGKTDLEYKRKLHALHEKGAKSSETIRSASQE